MDDSGIVDLFLKRDESAIIESARAYGPRLRKIAGRVLRDPLSVEECENDTYLYAWNSIPPHEPRTYLFAYLARIIRNLAIDVCRKNEAQKRTALFSELTEEMTACIPGSGSAEEAAEADELARAVDRFLSGLPDMKRRVFIRRYWFFDSVSEIASRYGYSESKVKVMLYRMREALRHYLEKEGYVI